MQKKADQENRKRALPGRSKVNKNNPPVETKLYPHIEEPSDDEVV